MKAALKLDGCDEALGDDAVSALEKILADAHFRRISKNTRIVVLKRGKGSYWTPGNPDYVYVSHEIKLEEVSRMYRELTGHAFNYHDHLRGIR